MKLNNLKAIILTFTSLLLTSDSLAQDFKELKITLENLNTERPTELFQLDVFGHHYYSLYGSVNIKKQKKSDDESLQKWKYKTLCSTNGKLESLNIDSIYMPVSFLNNDTLIVKNLNTNIFSGIRMSDKKLCNIDEKIFKALKFYNPAIHRIKINNDYSYSAMLDKQSFEINLFKYDDTEVIKISLTPLLDKWKCSDFYWIEDKYLLLNLLRPSRYGNDLEHCQKVYNTTTNKIEDVQLPKKNYQLEDYNNGYCIVRTLKSQPVFIIYKILRQKNMFEFLNFASINIKKENLQDIGNLEFIAYNKIIQSSNVIGDKGILVISSYPTKIDLEILKKQ